eukprot:5892212-Alexandrium_andersonii.AAC.1
MSVDPAGLSTKAAMLDSLLAAAFPEEADESRRRAKLEESLALPLDMAMMVDDDDEAAFSGLDEDNRLDFHEFKDAARKRK